MDIDQRLKSVLDIMEEVALKINLSDQKTLALFVAILMREEKIDGASIIKIKHQNR